MALIVGDAVAQWLARRTKEIERSGFEPWPGHCVVFLGKTLNSHNASLRPGVNVYRRTVRET